MSYLEEFDDEYKPLAFTLTHKGEVLAVCSWDVPWHGEDEDGSDLTLDGGTVREILTNLIDDYGSRKDIADELGFNERKAELILQHLNDCDYSNFEDLREEYYETPESHRDIRNGVRQLENVGKWIFNPQRQSLYGVSEEQCNSFFKETFCYAFEEREYEQYNKEVLTKDAVEEYAKENGPFYLVNITEWVKGINVTDNLGKVLEKELFKERGLDPETKIYPVFAGALLPLIDGFNAEWFQFVPWTSKWEGLAGRVLEDGIFDKENVLKFG